MLAGAKRTQTASFVGRILVACVIFCATGTPATAHDVEFARDQIVIRLSNGESHSFNVELAVTPQQREHGLMFRESLDEDDGMLFLYTREKTRSVWMKNTYISLDLLFINAQGEIVDLTTHTVPLDDTSMLSGVPALAVLEVLAGTVARLGISIGDRIDYKAFERD